MGQYNQTSVLKKITQAVIFRTDGRGTTMKTGEVEHYCNDSGERKLAWTRAVVVEVVR